MDAEVTRYLQAQQVAFEVRPHSAPVYTSEDAARERGVRLSQIVKTMVGQDGAGNLYVALLPGDRMLKLKRLRQAAGGLRIDLVPPEELSARLGLTVGAIAPVQLVAHGARFFMDATVLAEPQVTISAGRPDAGLLLSSRALQALLGATVCDIISTREG